MTSLDTLMEHIREVYCNNDEQLFQWIIEWMHSMINDRTKRIVLVGEQQQGKTMCERFFNDKVFKREGAVSSSNGIPDDDSNVLVLRYRRST